ncbi:MAG: response regulator [Xenococcaceae cyanobacterium]
MIRVLVADDQNVLRQALELYLGHEKDIEVIGTANNGAEALEKIELLDPDVAVLDMEMPQMDGLTTTRVICDRFLKTKVLILSSHEDENYIYQVLQAGARGYVLKTTSAKELASVVRFIHQGYFQLGPGLSNKLLGKLENIHLSAESIQQAENITNGNASNIETQIIKFLEPEIDKIKKQLLLEYSDEVNQIKQDVEEGLIIFQKKVSHQIKDGLKDLTNQFSKYSVNDSDREEQKVLRFQFVRLRESYEQLQKQFFLLRNLFLFTILAVVIVVCLSVFVKL